jgi:F5/8 type C domain/Cellulase (glycosyl hydrolase family 5)
MGDPIRAWQRLRAPCWLAAVIVSGLAAFCQSSALASAATAPDLALSRPTVASSVYSSSYPASAAVDGSLSTRWSSSFSDPQWIYVDLGATYKINEVVLNWETAYGKAYQIQVSTNAVNWTTIYSTTTGTGGVNTLTGLSGTGRYVRMYGTVRGTRWGYSLWKMSVYSVSATPTLTSTVAPFPSRLRASGRNIVDENNHVMPLLKGFNAQIVPWAQTDFNAMAAVGGKFVRQVIFWDAFQPTNGTQVDATIIAKLDTQIARAQAAGLYSMLDIHLNVGRDPSWVTAQVDETTTFMTYGRFLTQYLANRYGNPSSPQYTKSVVGFGLNEPPVNGPTLNGNHAIPYIEGKYRTLISWFRASAPSWIGFVGYAYSGATPIFDPSFQNANATNADPHAYDSVGGNVVIDFHDYMEGVTGTPTNGVRASDPTAQVRLWNGMPYPDFQGGPLVGPNSTPAPTYANNSTIRSQMALFIAPYKQFSINANIPLMIGEWGWVPAATGGVPYATDMTTIFANAGAAIENEWNYDVTLSQEPFAAAPNHAWQPWTTTWMSTCRRRRRLRHRHGCLPGSGTAIRVGGVGDDNAPGAEVGRSGRSG